MYDSLSSNGRSFYTLVHVKMKKKWEGEIKNTKEKETFCLGRLNK